MNSKLILSIAFATLYASGISAKQAEKDVVENTNLEYSVKPISGYKNTTHNAIVYALPATTFEIEVTTQKTTKKAGQFYVYSQRYLGITDAIAKDETTYSLTNIRIKPLTIVDKNNYYRVTYSGETTAKNVATTPDGRLLCINCQKVNPPFQSEVIKKKKIEQPNAETIIPFTEEMIIATTTVKMAEEAAKYIFTLRENRLAIISGTSEHPVGDGAALKVALEQIDKLEKQYIALFAGTTTTEEITSVLTFYPEKEIKRDILFRFSKHLGVVDKENVSGNPLFISILTDQNLLPSEELKPTYSEKGKLLAEVPESGFIYRKPANGIIEIFDGNDKIFSNKYIIPQLGQIMSLPKDVLNDKQTAVKFCPFSGALLSIENSKN